MFVVIMRYSVRSINNFLGRLLLVTNLSLNGTWRQGIEIIQQIQMGEWDSNLVFGFLRNHERTVNSDFSFTILQFQLQKPLEK